MQPHHHISKALGSLQLQLMQHRLLLLNILGSLLLHVAIFSGFSFTLPQITEDQQTLDMHLVQQQTKPDNIQGSGKQNELVTKYKTPKTKVEPKPVNEETNAKTDAVNSTENAPINPAANIDQTANVAQAANESANTINDTTETVENNLTDSEPEPKKTFYSHVETEFEVMRGINTSAAGVTKISFNIDANGRYSIISKTQAKGLVSLFFGNLTQKSEGTVTEKGLKPDFYSYQYNNDAKKLQTANFNWNDSVLYMHTYKGETTTSLVDGTQDFLSFMYQFMFMPPLDSMQITMTNGKRLRTYNYSFEGEETITTKLGVLKTVHLLKGSGDEDKTEIWLATDYQYLPVKIRKTEKDGAVIEQVATSIRTEIPN